jgi:hypothetical protein
MYVTTWTCDKHPANRQRVADMGYGFSPAVPYLCGWMTSDDLEPCREQMVLIDQRFIPADDAR